MYDTLKSIRANKTYSLDDQGIVELPVVNYNKLPKDSSTMSCADKSTLLESKSYQLQSTNNIKATFRAVTDVTNSKSKDITDPPKWNIDMDSVVFTPYKIHL